MISVTSPYLTLLIVVILALTSCTTQPDIIGLWQSTGDSGSIEFKATGEVIVVDNMSATVTGTYKIEADNLIRFELTASDILRDSVKPVPKTEMTAKIVNFNDDELQLHFAGEEAIENYRRIR